VPPRKLRRNELKDPDLLDLIDGPVRSLSAEDMRPYQLWMSQFTYDNPYVLMGAGMGLGKTGAALLTARRLLDEGVVTKVLIVAPVHVANNTWPEEMRVWTFARALTYSILTGAEEDREKARQEDTEIHIINRENIVWLFRQWGRKWPYDMMIYDEASRLKAAKRKTTEKARADGTVKAKTLSEFGALTRIRMYLHRVIELSGTPAPNGLIDLWGPLYILDRGQRLGTSKTAFENRWFRHDRFNEYKLEPFAHSQGEIMGLISDVFVSLRKEDYLTLPPLQTIDRWITLPPAVLKKYRDFEREMVDEELDVEAVNKGVLTGKLLQFANGSMYDTEKTARAIHDLKLRELESIVEESGGAPMLIAYSFKFDLDRIKKRFPHFRIFGETKHDMQDWNAGKIQGLLVHPASAGHGMNFQYGGNIAVWYGLNWSLELYQQFSERLPRSGQKAESVRMYRILAHKTEDVRMAKLLETKGMTQDGITEMVRVRLAQLRKAA
jgi:SNF2 family DNA or RNA helicase